MISVLRASALIASALVTRPALAFALDLPGNQDKVVPCRPTNACTADLAAPGMTELEAGTLFHPNGTTGNQSSYPILTKWTLARWAQLQLGSNGYTVARGAVAGSYFDDVTIGGKFHLVDQNTVNATPSLAVSVTASVPTAGTQAAYSRDYDVFFVVYASRDFGAIHLDFNTGVSLWNVTQAMQPQFFAALDLSTNITSALTVTVEGYGFTDASPVTTHDAGSRVALGWALRPWLVLDAGGDVGFYPSLRSYALFGGFTVSPLVLWR